MTLREQSGCTRLDLKGCATTCNNFCTCKARRIVEELNRPMPSGKPYKPRKSKAPNRQTNAQLAVEYGITERQVAKAVKESLATGKAVQTILRRKSDERGTTG